MSTWLETIGVRLKVADAEYYGSLRQMGPKTKQQLAGAIAGFKDLRTSVAGISPVVGALGSAFAGLSLTGLAQEAIRVADELKNLGQQTGVSASFFSALQFEIEDAGSSLQSFASAITFMNRKIGEATSGNKAAIETFESIGVSLEDLQGLDPQQQFLLLSNAVSELGTDADRTGAAIDVFGRGIKQLIPLVSQGGDAIESMAQKQIELGNALSQEQIDRIDDFGDAMGRWSHEIKNNTIGAFADLLLYLDELDAKMARAQRRAGRTEELGAASAGAGSMGGAYGEAIKAQQEREREQAIADYQQKAKAGGFETQATFGNVGLDLKKEYEALNGAEERAVRTRQKSAAATKDANKELYTWADLQKEAAEIIERNQTPQEEYVAGIQHAKELLKAGAIDLDTYNREMERLGEAFKNASDESVISARIIKDSFADALEESAFNFESWEDTVMNLLEGVARNLYRQEIADPISKSVTGGLSDLFDGISGGSSGKGGGGSSWIDDIGSFFGGFFADGGRPPVGKASMVGEEGPELFVPDSAGTVVPNKALGGSNITVVQNISMSPGLQGTVEAEVRRASPSIAALAHDAVFASIQRGGNAAKIVGKR